MKKLPCFDFSVAEKTSIEYVYSVLVDYGPDEAIDALATIEAAKKHTTSFLSWLLERVIHLSAS